MSLVGVRQKKGGSAELTDLDWTGVIEGTLAIDGGGIQIPGAVAKPELTVSTSMSLKKGSEFNWGIRAKVRAVQVASIKTRVEMKSTRLWYQRLNHKHDESLSEFVFQFQLAPLHQGKPAAGAWRRHHW